LVEGSVSDSFVELYRFDQSEEIRAKLTGFIMKLYARFSDCSRGLMIDGWRSPEGDWERGEMKSEELTQIKRFVEDKLPWPTWDFRTFFEVGQPGGTITNHVHIEFQNVAHYFVEGDGPIEFKLGQKIEMVDVTPGLIAIVPAIVGDSVTRPLAHRRISAVLNSSMVVQAGTRL
jgi:hypothetical protein